MEMENDQGEIDNTIMSVESENTMTDGEHCNCSGSSLSPSSSTDSGENSRTPSPTSFSFGGISLSWPKMLWRRGHRKAQNRVSGKALKQALINNSANLIEEMRGFEGWVLNLKKLKVGKAFAGGGFGKVFKGTYGGEEVAIKLLERPTKNPLIYEGLKKQFDQEVTMLATIKPNKNIVRFIGACVKPSVWCIVTEYAERGSLQQLIDNRTSGRGLYLKIKHALEIARGMAHIHEHSFIHRDLKSHNLLIGNDGYIKIADFGFGRIEDRYHNMTPESGTYSWMAPEMMSNRSYTSKVDVYSFGVVVWELVTGLLPFNGVASAVVAELVLEHNVRPAIPDDCLPGLANIMTRCWDADPNQRPTFPDLIHMLYDAEAQSITTVGKPLFRRGS